MSQREALIELSLFKPSIRTQCDLLNLYRSNLYYQPIGFSDYDFKILNRMDEIHTEQPWFGHRRLHESLKLENFSVGRDRVRDYMKVLDIEAIYPAKRTTIKNKQHKTYPYLLRGLAIEKPNQVWATDITYIRMNKGFCYLVAVIDWYSRMILSWELSNTLDKDFCIAVLIEALTKYPHPDILNSDQGCQFTSPEFTEKLLERDVKVSMNGKGRSLDNIIIERFWWSIKHENIYLNDYNNLKEIRLAIENYMLYYNQKRIHQSLNYQTPFEVYFR